MVSIPRVENKEITERIVSAMKGRDFITLNDIVERTKIPRTTVYNHLNTYLSGKIATKVFGTSKKASLKFYKLNRNKKDDS